MAELAKRFAHVDGLKMAYVDTQPDAPEGTPIIWFQHGNPTSSHLWRHSIAALSDQARCIAPDLIGMGDSQKLRDSGPDQYRFDQHYHYLQQLMAQLVPDAPIILVLHDWGSALGFHWAQTHVQRVAAIAYMEAITRPLSWDDWPENARAIFKALRSDAGEHLVLEKNVFVERILPASTLDGIAPDDMAVYRRPYLLKGEDRRPTLSWPRELPIDGSPVDMVNTVSSYGQFLKLSDIPKLFINAEPGSILVGPARDFCRTWSNQEEVTVRGVHFLQEDSGEDIARTLRLWLAEKGLIEDTKRGR